MRPEPDTVQVKDVCHSEPPHNRKEKQTFLGVAYNS